MKKYIIVPLNSTTSRIIIFGRKKKETEKPANYTFTLNTKV